MEKGDAYCSTGLNSFATIAFDCGDEDAVTRVIDQASLRGGTFAVSALMRANIALRTAPRWNGSDGNSSFEVATTDAMNFDLRVMGLLRWVILLCCCP